MRPFLLHIPKTGGTSLLMNGIRGGHHITYEKGKKYITIIRNPINRTISHFSEINQKNQNRIDIHFIRKYADFQTKWLKNKLKVNTLEEIKTILTKDFKVYITERLPKEFAHFNTTRRKYLPTLKEKNLIMQENKLDFELYEWVCSFVITN